ncbi:2-amino-4-hydroxy-6-hydroxymethyldihydropteridine diphosphokinase [Candidatus Poribacteria bacterium]|nr:2-amino-4-hydroxy-6-hydroxymethyldihydropteridine diphosphokinase [Candidatus Poribacteria bacterium]MBT7805847.1 2-amino-4-hydroxy-6-hydroxymethyldihydropteridine diphosphokinase [Candidatus Poribacteria bacterium]
MERMAYVGLGSNVGDRLANLVAATEMLDGDGCRVTVASSVYETEPVGYADQDWFLNAVVGVGVRATVRNFHARLKGIEADMGRRSRHRWGPREIDLDLLLFEGETVQDDTLTIPHPRMHERAFVMRPLAEIAPDVTAPSMPATAHEVLNRLNDPAEVRLAYPSTVLAPASQARRKA